MEAGREVGVVGWRRWLAWWLDLNCVNGFNSSENRRTDWLTDIRRGLVIRTHQLHAVHLRLDHTYYWRDTTLYTNHFWRSRGKQTKRTIKVGQMAAISSKTSAASTLPPSFRPGRLQTTQRAGVLTQLHFLFDTERSNFFLHFVQQSFSGNEGMGQSPLEVQSGTTIHRWLAC